MRTRRLRTALVAAALAASLGACGEREYTKDNASPEQRERDIGLCRAQVDDLMGKDRRIDADRAATVRATADARTGAGSVRDGWESRNDGNRSERLMDNCMRARGYRAPQRQGGFLAW